MAVRRGEQRDDGFTHFTGYWQPLAVHKCSAIPLLDGITFLFSFSLISLFCKSLSMKKNGSHVIMLLIAKHKYQ